MRYERFRREKIGRWLLRRAICAILPELSLGREEYFGKVAAAELIGLSAMAKYLEELPAVPKPSAQTRTAQMFGDVQNIISMYNQPAIWREIVNTFTEIRYLLAESRAYKEQEASNANLTDSLSLHLHRRKMQSFDWAIVKLVKMDDLVCRLLQESTSGQIVPFHDTKWELRLKWSPTNASLNRLHQSGELTDDEFNGIMVAVNECFESASGQFLREYRHRLIHSVTPSVDTGILYSRLYDRVGEVRKSPEGKILKAPNKTSTTAACVRSLQLRVLRLGFLQDGDVGVAAGRLYESRELQIKGVNFLRAHVAQHKRGIIRG
jgi:hypothetical protein